MVNSLALSVNDCAIVSDTAAAKIKITNGKTNGGTRNFSERCATLRARYTPHATNNKKSAAVKFAPPNESGSSDPYGTANANAYTALSGNNSSAQIANPAAPANTAASSDNNASSSAPQTNNAATAT